MSGALSSDLTDTLNTN